MINCCGVAPGSSDQLDGNGQVNVRVADAAKAAGVPRFVYIGVASDMGVTSGPAKIALGDYFKVRGGWVRGGWVVALMLGWMCAWVSHHVQNIHTAKY